MKNLNNLELFHFCEQFSLILKSGISSIDGLQILSEDQADPDSARLFKSMQEDMEEYGSFAHALENSGVFPGTMIAFAKVGEETGCLDEVMASLADFYQIENETSQQIRSAISYPLIMLGMMTVVLVALLVWVLPVFSQVFQSMGIEMTGISSGFLTIGAAISRYAVIFLALAVILVLFILFLFFSKKGHNILQKTLLSLPYLKEIPIARDYGRLTQAISMGLKSGLAPEESMTLTRDMLSDPTVIARMDKAIEQLRDGELFSDALTSSKLFTGMDARLIGIGFQAGEGDEVMHRLSRRYSEASADQIGRIIAVIEPTIVILLCLLVGLTLLSVMMPLMGIFAQMAV